MFLIKFTIGRSQPQRSLHMFIKKSSYKKESVLGNKIIGKRNNLGYLSDLIISDSGISNIKVGDSDHRN